MNELGIASRYFFRSSICVHSFSIFHKRPLRSKVAVRVARRGRKADEPRWRYEPGSGAESVEFFGCRFTCILCRPVESEIR